MIDIVKEADVCHLVQFYSATCGHCHEFARIFIQFTKNTADWYSLFKVLAIECQGNNYAVCHRFIEF